MNKFLLVIVVIVLVTACGHTSKQNKKISAEQVQIMMNNQEDVIIVDVRSAEEYASGHIENAMLLPVDEIKTNANMLLPDLEQTIIVYCRSGNRSQSAANELIAMGYTNVYDLGGINNWPNSLVK